MNPKGYWIARIDIHDADAYRAYVVANMKAFRKYGGRFLVRAGRCESLEGANRSRNVVIEFPDYEAARACYRSAEYAQALALRHGKAIVDLIVIEGYDGPQPADT